MSGETSERRRSSKPAWQREIAGERIAILMGLAEAEFRAHPERSDRYAELARKIGMRYNVKVPRGLRKACRECGSFLVPGANAVVRASRRTRSMETKCLRCGTVSRRPYAKERDA